MNAPRRDTRLFDTRRPWLSFSDPRIALGAYPRDPRYPDAACVHCFDRNGALIQSTHYDCTGKPCCPVCACNANRRVM
jgi:hypothetical protein